MSLPSFERPPVQRVSVAIVIDRARVSVRDIVAFYDSTLAGEFPDVHEHDAITPERETPWGETKGVTINISAIIGSSQPNLQLHARSEHRDWDVRIQRDWIRLSWMKTGGDAEYPRWPAIRDRMGRYLSAYIDSFGGAIAGVEVEYFNHLDAAAAKGIVAEPFAGQRLGQIEALHLHSHHRLELDGAKARLHLDVGPLEPTGETLQLALTVRGKPPGEDVHTALVFADNAREHIVKGFTEITPPEFHEDWGRT